MAIKNFTRPMTLFTVIPAWTIVPLLALAPFSGAEFMSWKYALVALLAIPFGTVLHLRKMTPSKLMRRISDWIMGGQRYNRSPWRG